MITCREFCPRAPAPASTRPELGASPRKMRATPKRERGARDSSPKLNGDGSPSKRRARRPSPAPPPRPSASAAEVAQRLADHDDCVRVASALLEDPRRPRTHADGVRRACQEGHAWLARVTVAEHAEVAVQPALLASVRAPPITYQPALPLSLIHISEPTRPY